jgi:outer membrane lipoprotein SlyB
MQRTIRFLVPVVCLALLGACASPSQRSNAPVYGGSGSASDRHAGVAYGRVSDIDAIGIPQEQPQGAGAVVGGIVGAIIGRQFGNSSSGKNVGTVAGAVGGAVVGNEIEKNARRDGGGVRVTVQLEQGGVRRFDFRDSGGLRVGDRVRIEGGQLYRL